MRNVETTYGNKMDCHRVSGRAEILAKIELVGQRSTSELGVIVEPREW